MDSSGSTNIQTWRCYSASVVDIAGAFVDSLMIKLSKSILRNEHYPTSSFLNLDIQACICIWHSVSDMALSFGYQRPMLMVPFKYRKDQYYRLIASRLW
ncbi:hypothetical protein Tco_1110833 [Tanacetum coccineum]|uniref:Uncharacterized protein n=1 Tax=Tanacetum coccineum TaxID=301880 RepID=A0ABQ5IJY2_9ASTR